MRRRRKALHPAGGSDSFLDVIANLVGIMIILIVLVGARIRDLPLISFLPKNRPEDTHVEKPPPPPDLSRLRHEIDRLRDRLLEASTRQVAAVRTAEDIERKLGHRRTDIADLRRQIEGTEGEISRVKKQIARAAATTSDLQRRLTALQRAVASLEKQKTAKTVLKTLHFPLPVSRPVRAKELLFECRQGRVTPIDLDELLGLVRQVLRDEGKRLRDRWEVIGTVGPVGPFRLKYKIERFRSTILDRTFADLPPVDQNGYSYGVTEWELVPVWPIRGESLEEALADGSRWRTVVDAADPKQVALTFFVYSDSFALYRGLRDYCHRRGFSVAGRPLLPHIPIAASRQGTVSRGQ